MDERPPHMTVALELTGLGARIVHNGCTVLEIAPGASGERALKLSPWTIAGANGIELFLRRAPREWSGEDDGEPACRMGVFEVPREDDYCRPMYRVLGYRYGDAETLLGAGETRVLHHGFFRERAFGRFAWQDAAHYALSDRQAVLDAAGAFHAALAGRDVKAACDMLAQKLEELGHVLGKPLAEMVQEQGSFFGLFFADPGFRLDAWDGEALDVASEAEGRVVRVTRGDGASPIQGEGAGRAFAFDLSLSKVRERWIIVR